MFIFQLKDFEDFNITSDLAGVRENCRELTEHLHSQLGDVIGLNRDIELTKRKLLEIQFNVTVISMLYEL